MSWDANSEADLAGYEVSLARYHGERSRAAVVTDGSLSMKLDGLENGKPYYLTVRAFDTDENIGPWADEVTATPNPTSDDDDAADDDTSPYTGSSHDHHSKDSNCGCD